MKSALAPSLKRKELIERQHEIGKSPFAAVRMNEDDGCPPTPDIAHNTGAGSSLDCLVCSNLNFEVGATKVLNEKNSNHVPASGHQGKF